MTVNERTWKMLRDKAIAATKRAYVPYSNYPVGAAALTTSGSVVSGCNVENAAYGVALCAECGLVSDLVNSGGGKLVAFVCVNKLGEFTSPCGRCRQVLYEHAAPGMLLAMPEGVLGMEEVLPGAFGPSDLDRVAQSVGDNGD